MQKEELQKERKTLFQLFFVFHCHVLQDCCLSCPKVNIFQISFNVLSLVFFLKCHLPIMFELTALKSIYVFSVVTVQNCFYEQVKLKQTNCPWCQKSINQEDDSKQVWQDIQQLTIYKGSFLIYDRPAHFMCWVWSFFPQIEPALMLFLKIINTNKHSKNNLIFTLHRLAGNLHWSFYSWEVALALTPTAIVPIVES